MKFGLARVCAFLFFSGACALVYQVAWFRELRLIFGASTSASAAVLAIFMGGLGVGGYVLGKRADKSENALRMYAHLEIVVAITAGATPLLVELAELAYLGLGGKPVLGSFGATVVRILLSLLVLGPSTLAMGGTLPAAARAIESAKDVGRQRVAALYGTNTFGAVTGAVAANFLFLEVFGTKMTLWIAALVNVLVGVTARAASRSMTPAEKTEPEPEAASPGPAAVRASIAWFPPAAAFVSGGTFMLMELVWYRMLGPLLGGSSYTFGLILAVALAGIGLGGAIYARSKITPSLHGFAFTCALEAVAIIVPYALGDRIANLALLLRPLSSSSFSAAVATWTVIAAIVVLPGAIVSGAQFPLVIGLYGRGATGVGKDVGNAYAANTLGAIIGSLAGGFGLLPALSAPSCWRLVVILLTLTAAVALALEAGLAGKLLFRRPGGWGSVALAFVAVVCLGSNGPSAGWRHTGIGAGRADHFISNKDGFEALRANAVGALAWEMDGVESSVGLESGSGYTFIVNGKADGHAIIDSPTQIMSGIAGALIHPNPRRALVIGLGTGSTAGWLGAIPSMERVDVIELEPAILRVAKDCAPVNQNVLDNPKVVVHLGDAREGLRTIRARFDIIFSEPSNPYRAGISSMYTVEYYEAAQQRLQERGMFIQWMQAYEVDERAVTTVLTTLKQVFPFVSVWHTMRGDLLFVARMENEPVDVDEIRRRVEAEPYRSAVRAIWGTGSAEGVLAHHLANPNFAETVVQQGVGVVNRDDQNFLEFAFARTVGVHKLIDLDLASIAHRLGVDKPKIHGAVDDKRMIEERWLHQVWDRQPLDPPVASTTGDVRAFGDVLVAVLEGRLTTALNKWKKLQRTEVAVHEARILAETAARIGDPLALELIPRVHGEAERELLRAHYLARVKPVADVHGAVDALERGFRTWRSDPWVKFELGSATFELAYELGRTDQAAAKRLFDALAEPFAAQALRNGRLHTRARIGLLLDAKSCMEALAALEPPKQNVAELTIRSSCYRKARDPRREETERELARLIAEQQAFVSLLPDAEAVLDQPAPKAASADAGVDAEATGEDASSSATDASANAPAVPKVAAPDAAAWKPAPAFDAAAQRPAPAQDAAAAPPRPPRVVVEAGAPAPAPVAGDAQ